MKSLTKFSIIIILFLVQSKTLIAQDARGKLVSKWKTEDNTVLEIFKTQTNNYSVKQISAGKPADNKHNSKLIGKDIIGSNNDFTGTVIDPSNNKEYKAKWILSADEKTLKLSVKWGILSFKETWTKMN
jgi:uncharacterized protein (DUF2147 family)